MDKKTKKTRKPGGGRKKLAESDLKSERIMVRLTPGQAAKAGDKAEACGVSLAEWAAIAVVRASRR